MFNFENFLRNEYFPVELPPCFNSQSYADVHQTIFPTISLNDKKWTSPIIFSGYKSEYTRRKFAVSHPEAYARIAKLIIENEKDIKQLLINQNHSLTVPLNDVFKREEVFARSTKNVNESKKVTQSLYKTNTVELRLDIQSFFNSIYTHIIPWSIHGKSIAKARIKDDSLLGNKLDKLLQALNNGQTNGILTGNAVSRVISEIILCRIDTNITKKLPNLDYVRYVDDYYIYLPSSYMIQEVMTIIRNELSKFELVLNESKIKINESPFLYSELWIQELQIYSNFSPEIMLEKSIALFKKEKNISILKYSLKKLRTISFTKFEWKSIEPLILNLLLSFPNLSSILSLIFINNEMFLDKQLIKNTLLSIIESSISNSLDEELIWALWIIKLLNIELRQSSLEKVLNTSNWLAIIIALDIANTKIQEVGIKRIIDNFRNRVISEHFDGVVNDDDIKKKMSTEVWLLAYEAERLSLLLTSPNIQFEYASKVPFFNMLYANNVRFYNPNYEYQNVSTSKESNLFITHKEMRQILEDYTNLDQTKEIPKIDFELLFEKAKELVTTSNDY